jgi:hypothetical protein
VDLTIKGLIKQHKNETLSVKSSRKFLSKIKYLLLKLSGFITKQVRHLSDNKTLYYEE